MQLVNQNDVEFKLNFQPFQSQSWQSRIKFETVKFYLVDLVVPFQSSYLSN